MAKYEKWLKKEELILIQAWARDGLSDEQIARNMGISASTLREWKGKFPAISAALKNGKEVVDIMVENALFKAAMAGEAWAVCFWLKNRRPDKWRDKPDDNLSTEERKAKIAQIKASTAQMAGLDGGADEDDGVTINYGTRDLHRGSGDPEADAGLPG